MLDHWMGNPLSIRKIYEHCIDGWGTYRTTETMIRKKPAATPKSKQGQGEAVVRPKSRPEPGTRMSVLLSNPDYLLEGFAEKKCQYIGVLEEVPTSSDMSSRGFLLDNLDNQRNLGKLPWSLGPGNTVTMTLSAYNLKIIKEGRTGAVLHRIPIHEISSASYVNDDNQHLLFIKAGDATKPYCPCYVLCCAKRADAEEVCSILQQAFQLVYTEATMQHLNESISAGERGIRTTLIEPGNDDETFTDGQLSYSLESIGEPTAEELVQEYMERLHKLLDFRELREFATLLKRYRDDLPVTDFLSRLQKLYGKQRSFLIPDMRSFIPEEDRGSFEAFLVDNQLMVASPTASKPHPPPDKTLQVQENVTSEAKPVKSRRRMARHQSSHVADVDKFLQDIDAQMDGVLESTNF